MLQSAGLVDHRLGDRLVAVAHAHREDAPEEVQVVGAVGISQVHTPPTDREQWLLVCCRYTGEEILPLQLDQLLGIHPSGVTGLHDTALRLPRMVPATQTASLST